jgi:hypothetical protein
MQAGMPQTTPWRKISTPLEKIVDLLLFATIVLLAGCAAPEQERAKFQEAPPNENALVAQPQTSPTIKSATLPPPKLAEVQDAVKRIFKDAALIDTSRSANFAVGDFNGDRSQDLAVVVTPAPEKLSEINEAAPPWILRDPFVTSRPGMVPPRITENETLLAVIHGFGPEGWRDPQATQTFLLKSAVGPVVEIHSKTAFMIANRGRKVPQLRGDLIAEVLRGTSGYLYYDDAGYSWYDPKTYKEEPVKRLVHSGMAVRK